MKQLATIALLAVLAFGVYAGVRGGVRGGDPPPPMCLPDIGCGPG